MDKQIKENISFESKEKNSVPKGAKVLKTTVNTNVKEIENGFILRKSYDIKYSYKSSVDYCYYTKEVFSETNPIQIKEDKNLADYFD